MGKGLLTSLAAALGAAGVALGQPPVPPPAAEPPPAAAVPAAPTPAAPRAVENAPPPVTAFPPTMAGAPDQFAAPPGCGFDSGCPGPYWLFTTDIEYLLNFFPRGRTNTIIASDAGTGVLVGNPLVVASDRRLDKRAYSGGRLTFGMWAAEPNGFYRPAELRSSGIEASIFTLGEQSIGFRNAASPTILRPFFDANNRVVNAVVVAAPGLATGEIAAEGRMNLWGGEVNVWRALCYNGPCTTGGLGLSAGVRYLEADPEFEIRRSSQFATNLAAFPAFQSLAGNRIQEMESFSTRNRFIGGQVGVDARFILNPVVIETGIKLALGANNQELTIDGSQTRTFPNGVAITSPGALLALPSNIGNYTRTKFSQVPELDLKVSWPVTPCLTLKFDVMALFWSKVLRPRDQIDRAIDVTQIPSFPGAALATPTGLRQPDVPFRQSDLWTLGLGFGAEYKW